MLSIIEWDNHSDRHLINLMRKTIGILKASDTRAVTVIDIGSNVGKFIEMLQDGGIQVETAILCDIVPELTDYTRKKFPQFISLNVAVSDTDESTVKFINLVEHENNLGLSRITENSAVSTDANNVLSIETMTVERIVKQFGVLPNLIKIDAEGHDIIILNSVIDFISSKPEYRPMIIFECAANTPTVAVIERLVTLGYRTATWEPIEKSRDVFAIPQSMVNSQVQLEIQDMPHMY